MLTSDVGCAFPSFLFAQAVGTVALGLGMATDLITSASLCWFLRNLKTGYKK